MGATTPEPANQQSATLAIRSTQVMPKQTTVKLLPKELETVSTPEVNISSVEHVASKIVLDCS
jgi:hypothetical protein